MSDSGAQPHAAYIEDYNEDAHTTLPETRQTANVAAKRSKPDMTRIKRTEQGREEASDSGYSSRTGATLTSGDSSLVSKAGSATLTLDTSLESIAARKRKPPLPEKLSEGTPKSPQKPLLRRTESKTRPREGVRQGSCACEECLAKAKSNAPRPAPPEQKSSTTDTEQNKLKRTANKGNPPTSRNAKPVASKPTTDVPVLQPAQPRPRHPGTQSYRSTSRPVSFHGGVMPQPMYYQTGLVGRPPSTAALPSPFPPPSYPPPTTSYFPPHYQHAAPSHHPSPHTQPIQPPPYHLPPQPPQRQWPSAPSLPPQQQVIYTAPPIVDYPHSPQYNGPLPPLHSVVHRTFSERDRERPVPLRDEYFPFDEDHYRMPPPPVPPPKPPAGAPAHQRPSIRHAATTAARVPRHQQYLPGDYIEEEQIERSPRKYEAEGYARSRRPSLASRQSTATSSDRSHDLHSLERSFARMSVESSSAAAKQRRRMTYYGGPITRDLEKQAEAYQAQEAADTDATNMPLTADSLKLVRRKTQTSNSDAGSRASGEGRASREGSDVKPRSATGRRGSTDVKARKENDGFTMRFNVDLKGNAEGRTISLRQSRDGGGSMELSIGTKPESKETREKSRRRQSYIDGTGVKELEFARTASRMGRPPREMDGNRLKDRSAAPSRSRRSGSKSGRALMG
ncbi:MAG: hypothetical protein Q9181_002128 [Wetmoreana brouardii]